MANDLPRMMQKALAPPAVTGILLCALRCYARYAAMLPSSLKLSATARSELASIQPVETGGDAATAQIAAASKRDAQTPCSRARSLYGNSRGACTRSRGEPAGAMRWVGLQWCLHQRQDRRLHGVAVELIHVQHAGRKHSVWNAISR